jgi:hypothetical protein
MGLAVVWPDHSPSVHDTRPFYRSLELTFVSVIRYKHDVMKGFVLGVVVGFGIVQWIVGPRFLVIVL